MAISPEFWKHKTLEEMSPEEWEALCDGCGRCCLAKLCAHDTGKIYYTDVACHMLDLRRGSCTDYPNRSRHVSNCVPMTPAKVRRADYLTTSCAYRRIAEGRGLAWWHPLVSGRPETVEEAGISVRGRVISEMKAGPRINHTVDWQDDAEDDDDDRARIRHALFGGVTASVLLPFAADGIVALDALADHCMTLLKRGASSIAVLERGTGIAALSVTQQLAVLTGLVVRGVPASKMLPSAAGPDPSDQAAVITKAELLGCRGVLLSMPQSPEFASDEAPTWCAGIIQRAGGTIPLYLDQPSAPHGLPVNIDLVRQLEACFPGRLRGVRSGDVSVDPKQIGADLGVLPPFEVYAADDRMFLTLLRRGGVGLISQMANVTSRLAFDICTNANPHAADEAQRRLDAASQALALVPASAGLRFLLARQSSDERWKAGGRELSATQERRLAMMFDAAVA